LIVDDNQGMAKTLVYVLRIKGYPAEAVHSGAEALSRMDEHDFDWVVSDIKMPGISGVELNRAIKMRHPSVRFLLMTAYSTDNLVEQGLNEGALACLEKPLDLDRLFCYLEQPRA
jgi:DNA-binding NtrC family response regulator